MSEISRDTSSEVMNIAPDLFQFYLRGISELLAGDDFVPSSVETSRLKGVGSGSFKNKEYRTGSSSLFSNATGDGLSSHEKARLMAMLRQCVLALNKEADEMLDPVISMIRLRALMAPTPTKSCVRYQDTSGKDGTESRAWKRLKVSVDDEPLNISPLSCNFSGEDSPKEQKGVTEPCNSITRCNNRGCVKSMQKSDPDDTKVNDDLQILLVNKTKALEKMEKHSTELSVTLGRMKDKLEELLDIVISSCRPMTLAEKHHLRRLIEKLPPKNLNRVVEIIQRGKPPEKHVSHDIDVELQHEDDVTLWRIYFYVKAVENAVKLV